MVWQVIRVSFLRILVVAPYLNLLVNIICGFYPAFERIGSRGGHAAAKYRVEPSMNSAAMKDVEPDRSIS